MLYVIDYITIIVCSSGPYSNDLKMYSNRIRRFVCRFELKNQRSLSIFYCMSHSRMNRFR